MNRNRNRKLWAAICLLTAFAAWTAAVCTVDLQPIGPQATVVGFATLNRAVHRLTGVHLWLYTLTDWLSILPLCCVAGFALLGAAQWLQRKQLLRVDRSILALGGFYLAVLTVFFLFEHCIVNYRPILIDGHLEASYPSSTTMLVLCVMSTTGMQLSHRISSAAVKRIILPLLTEFFVML